MFLFTVIIALSNLALGYGLAVYLGWARLPELQKSAAPLATAPTDAPHGPLSHGPLSHGH